MAAVKTPQTPARATELQQAILADRAAAAFAQGRYVDTLIALDQRARLGPERVDLMILRGWAYAKLNRKTEARRVFTAAAGTGNAAAKESLAALDPPRSPAR